jgi:hypothetical protein
LLEPQHCHTLDSFPDKLNRRYKSLIIMNSSPKLVYRQIRIFVLPGFDGNHWVETVVGRVIKPVVERHKPEWMWFSRYGRQKGV